MNESVLQVRNLAISFRTPDGPLRAVRGVDFDLGRGETLGIVGESGSGKSVTCLSVLGLNPPSATVDSGEVVFDGENLLDLPTKRLRRVRGNKIAMIFQDPGTSLNPLMTVGAQVDEVLSIHRPTWTRQQRRDRVHELLYLVRIPEPEQRAKAYPHELSGGMRQRVMIAQALACEPDVLIADEPTTALDVTIQRQILDLLTTLRHRSGMSVIFVTHDLGVVAELCDQVLVMYGGLVMEQAPVAALTTAPAHPYTRGLIACSPGMERDRATALVPIPGSPPNMLAPPPGCPFAPRCASARNVCRAETPPLLQLGQGRSVRCWLYSPDAPSDIRLQVSHA